MKRLLKKVASVIVALGILVCTVPGFSAFAADPQLSGSVSLSGKSLFNRRDTVTVSIDLTSRAYDQITGDEPNDIVLLIDRSGSMYSDYSNMIDAARNFVDIMDLNTHRIGVIAYDSPGSTVAQPITDDKDILKTFLDTLETAGTKGSTGMGEGVNRACSMLASKRTDAQGTIVLMTDGQPDNRITALSSAASAKSAGYVFYTVALTYSDSSPANTMLKQMATSESDHYFVMDSTQLKPVYDTIAKKIGKVFPKNITVTQNIPAGLELVPGSDQNSIPIPTVTANRLTWSMNQMGEGSAKLVYQLQADLNSTETSALCGSGEITYTDYAGNTQTITLIGENVTITRPMLAVNGISPGTGIANVETNVTISGENFSQDCTVKVNGTSASDVVISADGRTITAKLPGLPEGTHRVTVTNSAGQYDYADFKVEIPDEKIAIYSVTPGSAAPKTPETLTIIGCGFTSPTAKVGSVKLQVHDVSPDGTSMQVDLIGLNKGIYTITVTNDKGEKATTRFSVKIPDPLPVVIDSITPAEEDEKTPVTVEIRGKGFIEPITAKVGSTAISVYDVSPDGTYFKADVPALNAGTYTITVTNKSKGSAKASFTVKKIPPPPKVPVVIDSITPDSEITKTDVTATIQGSGFIDPTVKIGSTVLPVSNIAADGTSMDVFIRGLNVGTYTITVKNKDGLSDTAKFKFIPLPPPDPLTITGITPDKGVVSTETKATITGTGFDSPTAKIGSTALTVSNVSAGKDSFEVDIPKLNPGTYTITVKNSAGSSAKTKFVVEKIPPKPAITVTGITPDTGDVKQAVTATITGTNFEAPTAKIGSTDVPVHDVAPDGSSLQIDIPPLAAGTYTVKITDGGNSATIRFKVVAPPPVTVQIDSITPDTAETGQSVTATIAGTGMTDPTVKVGSTDIPVTDVSGNGTALEVTLPDLNPGTYTITVTNGDGSSAKTKFTVTQPVPPPVQPVAITAISQDTEITGTPVTVTITGTGMTNPKVKIGSRDLAVHDIAADGSSLQADIPGLTVGIYTINVTNDQGQTDSIRFSFVPKPEPPAVQIDSITPDTVAVKTVTSITISGTGFDNPVVKVGSTILNITYAAPDGTSLTADLPELNPGIYTITVSNGGTSDKIKVTVAQP